METTCSHLQELEACRAAWQQTMQAELDEQRRAIEEAEAASQASLEARQVPHAVLESVHSRPWQHLLTLLAIP